MPTPAVSVLLPVRDAAATLPAALRSVARQRCVEFECVIVDDGSSDASTAIAREQARRDSRFRVVPGPARGLVAALNAGLDACRGEFVARMDADDWMHRERLRLQLEACRREELSAVGCHVRLFPRSGLSDGMQHYERWLRSIRSAADLRRERFIECPIPHPTLFARRELFVRLGYRERGWPEDYDLLLRMLEAGEPVGVVARRLLGWRDGAQRLSRTDASYSLDAFAACKAEHLANWLGRDRSYVLCGHGPTARRLRRALSALGCEARAIVDVHPRRQGRTIGGAPVHAPDEIPGLLSGTPAFITAVSGEVARGRIRSELAKHGLREERDFVCAA